MLSESSTIETYVYSTFIIIVRCYRIFLKEMAFTDLHRTKVTLVFLVCITTEKVDLRCVLEVYVLNIKSPGR